MAEKGMEEHQMKEETATTRICPICGRAYTERPALSRTDNVTLICPDCGTRQALEALGVGVEEQDQIIETIHRHTQE